MPATATDVRFTPPGASHEAHVSFKAGKPPLDSAARRTSVRCVDTYGQLLARLREVRGLSQRELAEAAGVTGSYLSRIERGDRPRPSLKVTRSLARELGVSERDLDPDAEEVDPSTGERLVELEERVARIENRLTKIDDALNALRGGL
jgi:transcriptional regulator with XRE-family HTH domain